MNKCYKCGSEKVWKQNEEDNSLHLCICEECMKTTSEEEFQEIWNKLEKESKSDLIKGGITSKEFLDGLKLNDGYIISLSKYREYLNNLTGKEFAPQIKFKSEESHEQEK